MSNSNVVNLYEWFETKKPGREARRNGFASTRETFELLTAFSQIESPTFRTMIIEMAREVVLTRGSPSERHPTVQSFIKNRPADAG
jgi:hypothetical protein